MSEGASKILIADDHPLFREALQQVVAEAFDAHDCVEAENLEQASHFLAAEDFDLVLLDLKMPGMNGFTGLVSLRNQAPATPIIIVSAEDGASAIHDAITFGAAGYIPKSLSKERMAQAVREVMAGEVFLPAESEGGLEGGGHGFDDGLGERLAALTPQQRCVLEMLVTGKSNKVIAYELNIAESTVKAHVSAILRKLQVTNRTQAVINASKILVKLREPARL